VSWGVILNFIHWKVAFLEGLEGTSWRGTLDLDFRVIIWTHCWKVNIFNTFLCDIRALWISCACACKAQVIISLLK